MTAERACGCGAILELEGDALHCPACGCRAQTWLVLLDGAVVAAADLGDIYLRPGVLSKLLGLERN